MLLYCLQKAELHDPQKHVTDPLNGRVSGFVRQNTLLFMMLDANYGYLQIRPYDWDKDKTTLTSHHVQNRLSQIPFGPKNAMSMFQHRRDIVLSNFK